MKYSLFTINFEMKALAAKIVAFLAVIQLSNYPTNINKLKPKIS